MVVKGLEIGVHGETLDAIDSRPTSWSSWSSNVWSSSAWNGFVSISVQDGNSEITYLSLLGLDLFVKSVCFVLETSQHCLGSWSVKGA